MAKQWMQKADRHPGAFTKKAKDAGLTVPEFTAKVRSHPGDFSAKTKKQANLAKTYAKYRPH